MCDKKAKIKEPDLGCVFCSTKEKEVRIRGAGASAHPDFAGI